MRDPLRSSAFVTVSLREASSACFCSSTILARMVAQAANVLFDVRALEELLELGAVGLALGPVVLDLGEVLVLLGQVAVVDVEVQADEADVVLGALLHAAEQFSGDELVLAEVLGVLLEAGERVHAREGDNRQRQAQNTERATEARGERQIADRGHVPFCRPTDISHKGDVSFAHPRDKF